MAAPRFRRFHGDERAAGVDNPDLLVPAGGFDHVFPVGQDDERGVVELGAERDQIARVVREGSGPVRHDRPLI